MDILKIIGTFCVGVTNAEYIDTVLQNGKLHSNISDHKFLFHLEAKYLQKLI